MTELLEIIKKHSTKPDRQLLNPPFAQEMEIIKDSKLSLNVVIETLNKMVADGLLVRGRCINDNYYYIK